MLLLKHALKPGEAIDDGNVQIKVVELTPGDPCAEAYSFVGADRVILRFARKTDQRTICEPIFMVGGGGSLLGDQCGRVAKESDIAAVYIKMINITDGWVYFELAK